MGARKIFGALRLALLAASGMTLVCLIAPWLLLNTDAAARYLAAGAGSMLGTDVTLGTFRIDPRGRLLLLDLAIGPMAGDGRPLLRLAEASVEWSLPGLISRQALEEVRLTGVSVELENRSGATSIDRLLARLDGGSDDTGKPASPPAGTGPTFSIDRIRLEAVRVGWIDHDRDLDVRAGPIDLGGSFAMAAGDPSGEVHLSTGSGQNLAVMAGGRQIGGNLSVAAGIAVQSGLARGSLHALFDGSVDLRPGQPQASELNLDLSGALRLDTLAVTEGRFSFDVDGQRLIAGSAELSDPAGNGRFCVSFDETGFELEGLNRYIQPFVDGVEIAGRLHTRSLAACGTVAGVAGLSVLPEVSGSIGLSGVSAAYRPERAKVSRFDLQITPTVEKNRLSVQFVARAARLVVDPLVAADDAVLRLDASGEGFGFRQAEASLMLDVGSVRASGFELPLRLEASASGEPESLTLELQQLRLAVADALLLVASGRTAGVDKPFHVDLEAHIDDPVRLLAILPVELAAYLDSVKGLRGRTLGRIGIDGVLSTGDVAALIGSSRFTTALSVEGFGFDAGPGGVACSAGILSVAGGGTLSGAELTGRFGLGKVSIAQSGGFANAVSTGFTIRLKRDAIHARIDGSVASAGATGSGLSAQNIGLSADLSGSHDGLFSGSAGLRLDEVTLKPAGPIRLAGIEMAADIAGRYEPAGGLPAIGGRIDLKVASLDRQGTQPVSIQAAGLSATGRHDGGRTDFELHGTTGRIALDGLLAAPVESADLTLAGAWEQAEERLNIKRASLTAPGAGLALTASGEVSHLSRRPLPDIQSLSARISYDAPRDRVVELVQGVGLSGSLGLAATVSPLPGTAAGLTCGLNLSTGGFGVRYATPDRDGRWVEMELDGIDSRIDLHQDLLFTGDGARPLLASAGGVTSGRSVPPGLYEPLRIFREGGVNLEIGRLAATFVDGVRRQRVEAAGVAGDLVYRNGILELKSFYLTALGGDMAGRLKLAVRSAEDLDLSLAAQLTGINLGHLTAAPGEPVGPETELSGLVELRISPFDRSIAGEAFITRISPLQFDRLLVFMDPDGTDANIQKTRAQLDFPIIKPQIDLISIWVVHGNLNMDVSVRAMFPVGWYIRRVLAGNRIRRINVLPVIERYLPVRTGLGEEEFR